MPLLYCMYVHKLVFATTRFLAKPVTYYNKLRSILKKIDYKFQEFCCPKRRNLMRSTLKLHGFFSELSIILQTYSSESRCSTIGHARARGALERGVLYRCGPSLGVHRLVDYIHLILLCNDFI